MGKPRRPRSRPAGTPQPLQDASAAPEIQAADAPVAADQPDPATGRPVEAAAPPAEALMPEVTPEVTPDAGSDIAGETAPDGTVGASSDPVTEAAIDVALPPVTAAGPGRAVAANRIVFTPDRLDVAEIGSIIARYVRGEGEAAVAHLRALSGARSPADLIRLQVGEVQRAADASLTCWVTVVGQASRVVAYR
ncbi:phasin family protein [Methylobacterium sp.]|uniref:phasin family protein n=1 Tax=Methylobacterium sp. TaxID=409 RepID=UPI0005BDCBE9|nr:phasin family protein [Methylobacterium sp.]RUP17664.1 MAG: phasin family protein [Methylobacterium sp.]